VQVSQISQSAVRSNKTTISLKIELPQGSLILSCIGHSSSGHTFTFSWYPFPLRFEYVNINNDEDPRGSPSLVLPGFESQWN